MSVVVTESGGLRLLGFGTRWWQGAMRIAAPDSLELEYAARMFGWLLFHDLDTLASQHLVTLGLGAGSLTRFAHNVLGMRATAVEIDTEVIEACRTHFGLPPEGQRLRVVHAEGGDFIARDAGARDIDVLQVDAYDANVDRPALDSVDFYAGCRARLREGGSVALNLIGHDLDVRACVARLREGLRPRTVWQLPPTAAGNVVVIAHTLDEPPEALLTQRAAQIEQRWALPAKAWVTMARRWSAP